MSSDRHDAILDQDWGDVWDSLPEAPPLVPRPKTAQITLRIPPTMLARIKRVARARSLPYHALARSWILEGLHARALTISAGSDERQTEQINIKLDNEVLDELKVRADELRRPYHRLAREWIEAALGREEERLGIDPSHSGQPPLKDLMVLLLHATNRRGQDVVRGMTQLQKLLFVIEQNLASQSHFYAFNYGPFNEGVNDAARALRLAGFLRGTQPNAAQRPSFDAMMATIVERSGPRDQPDVQEFALNGEGHRAAEQLRQSSLAYGQLFDYISGLRQEWDTPDLLDRVYETWPEYAERSVIRDQVKRRTQQRRPRPK